MRLSFVGLSRDERLGGKFTEYLALSITVFDRDLRPQDIEGSCTITPVVEDQPEEVNVVCRRPLRSEEELVGYEHDIAL